MIVSQLIKAVYVRRDYEITVEFNISFDDFHTLEYHEKAAPLRAAFLFTANSLMATK